MQTLAHTQIAAAKTATRHAPAALRERARHQALVRLYDGVDSLAASLITAILCAGTAHSFE